MQNTDSLTLKFFIAENAEFLKNGVIQKIQMPKRTEIIFYIRNNGENKKLYINIDPKFPHLCFIKDKSDYFVKIPKNPPMFCMQLRKYLEGAKINDVNLVLYDRIIELYFSVSDEFGIENSFVLAIEIMGRYSNVILYNKKTGLITGSAHNVSSDKSSVREIYGGIKYIYPPKQEKSDILKTSYSAFLEKKEDISSHFYYFTKPFERFLKGEAKTPDKLFEICQNAVFEPFYLKKFYGASGDFNSIIFNTYSKIVNDYNLENKKGVLLKLLNRKIQKYDKILSEQIDVEKYERSKKFGDLIFQYIYLIKENSDKIILEGNEIKLNPALSPAQNAQKYYKLYSKLKSAKNILDERQKAAKEKKNYFEEIVFAIQNAENLFELVEIEDEINEFILLKKTGKKETPKIEAFEVSGFKIFVGKNNRQNDYLIRKISASDDIWLHAANCPSAHVVIKTGKKNVTDEVLLYAAKIVKENSPLKNSGKAQIIYTERKFVKRPPDTPFGYVTYREEKEIVVE